MGSSKRAKRAKRHAQQRSDRRFQRWLTQGKPTDWISAFVTTATLVVATYVGVSLTDAKKERLEASSERAAATSERQAAHDERASATTERLAAASERHSFHDERVSRERTEMARGWDELARGRAELAQGRVELERVRVEVAERQAKLDARVDYELFDKMMNGSRPSTLMITLIGTGALLGKVSWGTMGWHMGTLLWQICVTVSTALLG